VIGIAVLRSPLAVETGAGVGSMNPGWASGLPGIPRQERTTMRRERGSRIRGGGRGRGVLLLAACLSLTCSGDDGTGGDRVLRGVVYTTEPVLEHRTV
jgi:hypothetical protein